MATIFLSYSRIDTGFVTILAPQIRNIYGYASLWYDTALQGGENWWMRIVYEIRHCELVLFLMSDTSASSKWCSKELQKAIYNKRTILPILLPTYTHNYPEGLQGDLPDYMKDIQYVDFRCRSGGLSPLPDDLSPLWGAINRIRDHSISWADRWILYNQFEILKQLELNHRSTGDNIEHYAKCQKIISMGYEWNYRDISQYIQPSMEYGDCEEVITILDMFRYIYYACSKYDCSDIPLEFRRFQGFDGNEETSYLNYARFIVEQEHWYEELGQNGITDLNSHTPMLPKYRKMLEQWKSCEDPHQLTKKDVIRIVNAQ